MLAPFGKRLCSEQWAASARLLCSLASAGNGAGPSEGNSLSKQYLEQQQTQSMPSTQIGTSVISMQQASRPWSKQCYGISSHHPSWQQLRGMSAQPDPVHPGTAHAEPHAAPQAAPAEPQAEPLTQDVEYLGPLAKTHKLLKTISIANTSLALAAAPAIVMFSEISYVSRVGLATSLVLFGLITTGALHWITQPYVHRLNYTAATRNIEILTTTLFGRKRVHNFQLSDVKPLPWDRPVATFMAKGRFYYIDVYSFPDAALLKELTPPEDSVPAGYKDDKDD